MSKMGIGESRLMTFLVPVHVYYLGFGIGLVGFLQNDHEIFYIFH